MKSKIEINMDDATSVQEGLRLYRRQLFFSIIIYPVYIYILYQFFTKGFQNNDYVSTKDDIFVFAKHNIIFFVIIGCIVIEPIIRWPFQFFKINRLKKRLEELKGPNKKTICSDVVKEGSMLVRINGKEVEIKSSRQAKQESDTFFQKIVSFFIKNVQDELKEFQRLQKENEQKEVKERCILGWIIMMMGIFALSIMDPGEIERLNPGIDSMGMLLAYLIPISFVVVGAICAFSPLMHSKEYRGKK